MAEWTRKPSSHLKEDPSNGLLQAPLILHRAEMVSREYFLNEQTTGFPDRERMEGIGLQTPER